MLGVMVGIHATGLMKTHYFSLAIYFVIQKTSHIRYAQCTVVKANEVDNHPLHGFFNLVYIINC